MSIFNLYFIEEEIELCEVQGVASELQSQALNTGTITKVCQPGWQMGWWLENPTSPSYSCPCLSVSHTHTALLTPCPPLMLDTEGTDQFNGGEKKTALGMEDGKIIEKSHTDLALNCGHSCSLLCHIQ